ncbi:serine protease inhibitor 27A-like [Calliphora vicina]|uniref:serine protease inhibitor 27A-like n=1 Tax=Calliphora vicina TaxID=7373 RepID=UPI00325A585B
MLNHIAIEINNEIVKDIYLDVQDTIQAWLYSDICKESYYLTTVGQEVQLVLSTEIHFQNIFRYNIYYTLKRPFYASEFEIIEVDMLNHIANIYCGEIPQLNAKAFKVPYSDGDTSLVILLPNSLRGIKDLENNLKSFSLSSIDSYLSRDWVVLLFPKLEIVVERSLTDELKNLGMSSMFQRLCDTSDVIKVADVIFRASFYINETNSGLDPEDPDMNELSKFLKFEVNHPFIFFIQSSMNEIYLIGKFMK